MKNTSLDQRKKNVMHAWMEWPTKKCSKAQTPINNITGPDNDTTKNTTKIDNKENKASHETSQIRGNEHHLTPFPVLPCQVSAKDLHNLEPKNVFLKALASGLALGEWGYEPWWGLKIHLSLSSIGLASCHKSICMYIYIYIMPPVWNTGSKKKTGLVSRFGASFIHISTKIGDRPNMPTKKKVYTGINHHSISRQVVFGFTHHATHGAGR